MPDALRDLHASKYQRPRNKPSDGCLWKPSNRNSVCASKQLRFVAITETFNGNQALICVYYGDELVFNLFVYNCYSLVRSVCSVTHCSLFFSRLYGFKIHPVAYQLQLQAAANFKMPSRSMMSMKR